MVLIEGSKVSTSQNSRRLKHLIISFTVSAVIVGVLVGNAYMEFNIGYPSFFHPIGEVLVWLGLVAAVPPGIVLWGLDKIGLTWQLRGRESFIESNPWLWIYCVAFYTFAVYSILRFKHRRNQRKKKALIKRNDQSV